MYTKFHVVILSLSYRKWSFKRRMLDRTRQFRSFFERRANVPAVARAHGLACDWLVRRTHLHSFT